MRRRTLLTAVVGVVLAGCSTAESDGDPEADETDNRSASGTGAGTESEELSDADILEQFGSELEASGFDEVVVDAVDDGIEIGYDASGTTEDDVAAEIELIADGYTSTIEYGLSSTHLDATAFDPDDQEPLDRFSIDSEWIDAYLSESLEWRELLTRIAETFESEEPADEEGDEAEPDAEGESDPDEEGEGDDETQSDDNGGDGGDSDDGNDGDDGRNETEGDGDDGGNVTEGDSDDGGNVTEGDGDDGGNETEGDGDDGGNETKKDGDTNDE
ncbi:hypothetical protein [Natronorubrum sp. FCH18a]|uniref:hypothetical protein n=1 Tax=Natronorubrum sp. FCH18a TaxID=3447018 RepID=UPI003F51A84F